MFRLMATALAVSTALQCACLPAFAENQMGYKLLPANEAASLTRGGGTLGIDVKRAQQITDGDLTFDVLRVNSVRARSAGEKAGFKTGDQIIAVDGKVFPTVAAFAAYIGSQQPGNKISVDYMPAGGGPQQAQRVGVTLAAPNAVGMPEPAQEKGLTTGEKVAIGVGAAALFGCYKYGCFTRRKPGAPVQQPAARS